MDREDLGQELARAAVAAGHSVGVAESLTGGLLSACLAALPDAGDWYRGSVVAYSSAVKHDVLGVPPVPVVSEPAAVAMAEGVARVLGADVTIAVTGVGGPGPQDGVAAGTVWMAVHDAGGTPTRAFRFAGEPHDVVRQTCDAAVAWLSERLAGDGGRRARAG